MTTVFGNIDIQQITGGTVHFGYANCISPKAAVKDPSGGGSKNQGGYVFTSTGISVVNFIDPDGCDQQLDSGGCEDCNGGTGTSGNGNAGGNGASGSTSTMMS